MLHVFNASLSGRIDSIKNVGYLWKPKLNIYYVAAKETMKAGILQEFLHMPVQFQSRELGVRMKSWRLIDKLK